MQLLDLMIFLGMFACAVVAGCLYARFTVGSRLNRVVAVVIAAVVPAVITAVMALFADNESGEMGNTPLQHVKALFGWIGGAVLIVAILAASVTAAIAHFANLGRNSRKAPQVYLKGKRNENQ